MKLHTLTQLQFHGRGRDQLPLGGQARLPNAIGRGRILQDQRVESVVIKLLADIGMIAGRIEIWRDVERGDRKVAGMDAGG